MSQPNDATFDDLICHYTDVETLYKILENPFLWATSNQFLDDYSEGKFLIEQALQNLKVDENLEHLHYKTLLDDLQKFEAYITSFSQFSSKTELQDGNLAIARYFGTHEWVGIVFYQEKLKSSYNTLYKNYDMLANYSGKVAYRHPEFFEQGTFVDCAHEILHELFGDNLKEIFSEINQTDQGAYSKENFKKLIDKLLHFTLLKIEEKIDDTEEQESQKIIDTIYPLLVLIAVTTKHTGFQVENEKRLLFLCFKDFNRLNNINQKKNLHESEILKLSPVPHLEVPINLDAIHSIIIGPSVHQKKTETRLTEYKIRKNLEFEIVKSTIPWRPKSFFETSHHGNFFKKWRQKIWRLIYARKNPTDTLQISFLRNHIYKTHSH